MKKINTVEDLKSEIRLNESSTLEFKEGLTDIKEEVCAFLNLFGGKILIGVDNSGDIKGF